MFSPAFVASSAVVIMTPGPDLVFITRVMVRDGRVRSALVAASGMITAGLLQLTVGLLGFAVLLHEHPALFTALRWAGVVVLFGWGVRTLAGLWRGAGKAPAAGSGVPARRSLFFSGMLCTGSNPKVGLFLMAFLPQFVPPGVAPAAGIALLGAGYFAMAFAWLACWILLICRLHARLLLSPRVLRAADAFIGCAFIGFAVWLAI